MAQFNYYPESWGRGETDLWESHIAGARRDDFDELMVSDRQAIALFSAGWLEDDGSLGGNRMLIRDAFFDYAIEQGFLDDRGEFDWEAWREYMGYEQG